MLVLLPLAPSLTAGRADADLPECAHPYYVFKKAGYTIDFASPKGGSAPLDPSSVEAFKVRAPTRGWWRQSEADRPSIPLQADPECIEFLKDAEAQKAVSTTQKLSDIKDDYAAVFYVGGYAPLSRRPSLFPS